MENQFKVIGRRIFEIRQVLEISVAEMAKVTGITEEEYLKHENGVVESSFSFIMHCAERLGVDLSSIVSGESPKLSFYNITRKSDGLPIERREELEYRHLAPMLKNRHAEPLFVKARPLEDESMPIPLSTHTGLEKWKECHHKDIDSVFVDEAVSRIIDNELDYCSWCAYSYPSCNHECGKGIRKYLKNEVEEWS
jgi:transcriptional regulator with XRE-family HTH domain